jgi:transposase
VPEAKAGTEIVLVMDNLHEVHKMKRVRQLIEGRGCELLVVLPSYSPDSNPIEEEGFSSKIKGLLRKAKARSFESLVQATGAALRRQ